MEIYLVGGAVRDHFLGKKNVSDYDFVIIAKSFDSMVEQFKADGGFVYKLQPEFGRLRGRWKDYDGDFMVGRIDGFYPDGRHPETIQIASSIEEDLMRRDFTVNAFAVPVDSNGEFIWDDYIDLFNGLQDLRANILRFVGNMHTRIAEDALRLARYYRFQVQLGFEPLKQHELLIDSDETLFGFQLGRISVDRRRDELHKMFSLDTMKSIEIVHAMPVKIRNGFFNHGIKLIPTCKMFKHSLEN